MTKKESLRINAEALFGKIASLPLKSAFKKCKRQVSKQSRHLLSPGDESLSLVHTAQFFFFLFLPDCTQRQSLVFH